MQKLSFVVPLLFASLTTVCASSAQTVRASSSTSQPRLMVIVYHPNTSPIYVPTWTLNTDDLLGSIVIQNHSSKKIHSVEFTWIADTPTACFARSGLQRPEFGHIEERAIDLPPDRSIHVRNLGLKQKDMLMLAASDGRLLVDIQVVPSKVTFADGTVWRSKATFRRPYDHVSVHALAENCVGDKLVPVNTLLQAKAMKPDCSPGFSPALLHQYQRPSLLKVHLRDDTGNDPTLDNECYSDGDCGGGGEGDGGSFPDSNGDGGGDSTTGQTSPPPPPGAPANGWTCGGSTSRTYCSSNPVTNTCNNGYCATGAACASQICTAITQ